MGLMPSLLFWRRKLPIVPVVRLSGVIAARHSLGRRGLSLEAVEPQLKRAFSVKQAKAVVLLINSPGGSPVQSAQIGNRIRQLAAKTDIPVIAFCEDVAASGGYWLAAAADEIFANPASVVGSIGVLYCFEEKEKPLEESKFLLFPSKSGGIVVQTSIPTCI